MPVSTPADAPRWLLLVFSLPARNASERVEIWRKLRRYGVMGLKSSGYVLPRTSANEERLQWLATTIRKHNGDASVLQVASIDNLPEPALVRMFNDARNKEYEAIARELQKAARRKSRAAAVARLRRRYEEVRDRDFFQAPLSRRVELQFAALETPAAAAQAKGVRRRADYVAKTWVTRPRPGIDRVSSAWLIRRFIDPAATFCFARQPGDVPDAIPFDMFGSPNGFSHAGDECTFETLAKEFGLADTKVASIARAVHDADFADQKFGRTEALVIEQVLTGWAHQGISDDELLRRGMEMIEGFYHAI